MTTAVASFTPSFTLPWALSTEEDRRYRRILLVTLGLLALFGLLLPYLPVTQPEPPPPPPPKHYVKLLLKPVQPTPAPALQVPAPTAEQAEIKQQPSPRPAPAPAPTASPEPEPAVAAPTAREQARNSGILAMRDSLEALRRSPVDGSANTGPLSTGGDQASKVERSMLTSRVGDGSNGINVAELSRGIGPGGGTGKGFGNRTTARVESPIGLKAGGGAGGGSGRSNKLASRTDEEIQLVFDRNKGSIFGIYNRALRTNSSLQGKLVLRLTITPAGEVTDIGLLSSELGDEELERKLLLRIKQFNFGAKDVQTVTVSYPIEFFPS